MNNTLIGIGAATLVLLAVASTASAEGICAGICIGATPAADVWNPVNTQANTQACVGNAVIQVGLSNTNTMCNGAQTNENCQVKANGQVNCDKAQ